MLPGVAARQVAVVDVPDVGARPTAGSLVFHVDTVEAGVNSGHPGPPCNTNIEVKTCCEVSGSV